jgi:hypothetical protein|tara:strand:+ start:325 stop:489 length:165 start_codon:yes stop_codon:yes gene_type:complete
MAKFSRFDPKNKKKDRNKKLSINRDSKIKSVEKDRRVQGKTIEYVIQDQHDDLK